MYTLRYVLRRLEEALTASLYLEARPTRSHIADRVEHLHVEDLGSLGLPEDLRRRVNAALLQKDVLGRAAFALWQSPNLLNAKRVEEEMRRFFSELRGLLSRYPGPPEVRELRQAMAMNVEEVLDLLKQGEMQRAEPHVDALRYNAHALLSYIAFEHADQESLAYRGESASRRTLAQALREELSRQSRNT